MHDDAPDPISQARLTGIRARGVVAALGLVLALGAHGLHPHPLLAALGFGLLTLSSVIQLRGWRFANTRPEEAMAGCAAILVVGLNHQGVTILGVLWLCAAGCGIVSRIGSLHRVGPLLAGTAIVLPMVLAGRIDVEHLGFAVAAVAMILTCGHLARGLDQLIRQTRHDVDHDGLTGAWSRAALRGTLSRALTAGEHVRLLLVDLDDFGRVNKVRGHAEGDHLLKVAVQRLRERLPAGVMVGRLGGDEFAVLCRGHHEAVDGTEVLDALAGIDEHGGPISACVGVAHGPTDGTDADAVLRAADVAMRVAKRRGKRGAVVYDAASLTDDPITGAQGTLARLIAGNGLRMVVQPIVDVATGEVNTYEALTRFDGGGTTDPLHWFALADELGLRAELEIACVRAALEVFPHRPAGTRMSVNLSATLLLDRRVHALLDGAGDLEGLVVEVTEDSLAHQDAGLLVSLRPLLERGVVLAVDDVGAGYSGLGQLTALAPALVKLDRGLVTDIDRSPRRAALVEALVGYARRTRGEVVAEGVETEAELATVSALGVRLVQGYATGRPGAPWPAPVEPVAVAA